ncbi:MAG: nickel-dependent hydrogenase large subunit [Azonexus sp.]|nr:nickel-dependent hydrogenase large subunit [Betaproteobacteria bacterium]MBP6037605.1 nickel-dependent hydrogenase large subunit [Azonexus sp.]MBP6905731.1 nickel-dependent hydrogenase large subunit [Azonexus sp.]
MRISVGPFNRVEGDLELSLDLDASGQVVEARVNSPLFRGFEQLLVGRAPADALVIVPRICGICSVAQSAAAASALAEAAGLVPAPNGVLARHLIQATENLADHLSHFYLFFMPDFARPAYAGRPWYAALASRFMAVNGSAAAEVLPARANFLKLMGFLAGKWPHTLALQPGGSTRAITAAERIRILALLREFRTFLETRLLGDSLPAVAALDGVDALAAWSSGRPGDFPAFLAAAADLGLDRLGRAGHPYLSSGAYGLFPAGIWSPQGEGASLDPARITEDAHHAWLADGPPLPPARDETLVAADKPSGYTWCKAPRYDGSPAEVGALARQTVAGHPLLRDMVRGTGGSVTARVVARMVELATVLPAMETWVQALRPGEPFCTHADLPDDAVGAGLVEAARGTLGHWISVRRGRIERYQIVAPTTWNFSPRDQQEQPGPLEQALVGLPAGEGAPPTVQHVVRSFDPCMVCTVH